MAWTKIAREKAAFVKNKTGVFNHYEKAKKEGLPVPSHPNKGKTGTFTGKKHTIETKLLIQTKSLASPHRRLKRKMIHYNGVMLDSSWELELAKCLDECEIKWIRPKHIKWIDEKSLEHNYFPDFYLLEYDLYVDTKNPFAYKVQKTKIDILKKQMANLIFLCSIQEIHDFVIMIKQGYYTNILAPCSRFES